MRPQNEEKGEKPQNTQKAQNTVMGEKPQNTQKAQKMEEFPLKEKSHAILGAVFEVYREMGCGFLEAVYQECLERELGMRQIFHCTAGADHCV